jgi:adenine-specific DNA-methyltransferase
MNKIEKGDPDSQSADIKANNISQLAELFPEAMVEGKVDFEVLKQLLDGVVDENDEKYGLHWHGKRAAGDIAMTPSTGTLRPCPEDSVDWDTTQNLMIEGDNLEVLKILQKSYAGKVKMIYIDPPYNTGNDFIYPDNFRDSIKNYQHLTGQADGEAGKLTSNVDASGRFHTDWMNMMYPRLKLAQDLLAKDGAIFVSIDFNEAERLKLMLDDIFGEANFQRAIVWRIGWLSGYKTVAKNFIRNHDSILFFSKSRDALDFKKQYIENASFKPILKKSPKLRSKLSELGLTNNEQSDLLQFVNHENRPERYPMEDTWNSNEYDDLNSIAIVSFSGEKVSKMLGIDEEFKGQKSVKMLMRILESMTDGDDVVLDFFSGTNSTAHATMQLNADDQGSRRFIMVQLPEPTTEGSAAESAGYRTIADIGKERLRVAGKKIKESNPLFSGDLGFRVFKLDSSNINAWDPDSEDLEGTLAAHTEHIKSDRTEDDVLYELLLKRGLDLCVPIEKKEVEEKTIHSIGGGALFTCLADKLDPTQVEAIAQSMLDWRSELNPAGDTTCVFRDSAFKNDVAKTNMVAILEQGGIKNVRSL